MTTPRRTSDEYSLSVPRLFKGVIADGTPETFNVEAFWRQTFGRLFWNGHKFAATASSEKRLCTLGAWSGRGMFAGHLVTW